MNEMVCKETISDGILDYMFFRGAGLLLLRGDFDLLGLFFGLAVLPERPNLRT